MYFFIKRTRQLHIESLSDRLISRGHRVQQPALLGTLISLIPSMSELFPVLWSPTTQIFGRGRPLSSIPKCRKSCIFLTMAFMLCEIVSIEPLTSLPFWLLGDGDVGDSEVPSRTVAEGKEIVRSRNQRVHPRAIATYLANPESGHFEITSRTWTETRAARLR